VHTNTMLHVATHRQTSRCSTVVSSSSPNCKRHSPAHSCLTSMRGRPGQKRTHMHRTAASPNHLQWTVKRPLLAGTAHALPLRAARLCSDEPARAHVTDDAHAQLSCANAHVDASGRHTDCARRQAQRSFVAVSIHRTAPPRSHVDPQGLVEVCASRGLDCPAWRFRASALDAIIICIASVLTKCLREFATWSQGSSSNFCVGISAQSPAWCLVLHWTLRSPPHASTFPASPRTSGPAHGPPRSTRSAGTSRSTW